MNQKQTDNPKNLACDVAIMGGGIAGLTLGILLAKAGLEIVLAEPYPPKPMKDVELSGRSVALMNSSLHLIKACGVWDKIERASNPLQIMRIIDDSIGRKEPVEMDFPAHEIGAEQFGFNIPNAFLRSALFEAAQKLSGLTVLQAGFESCASQSGGIDITMNDSTMIHAALLAGADGRSSAVRNFVGIDITEHDYGQSAITCVINHSRSHQNISTEFHRPAGPFALVPLPGNQSSVVWVEKPERADALMRLKKQDFTEAMQAQTNSILGGITLETNPECWPLKSIKAKALSAPRIALLAEAAHVISPITAQGLNLSLRDVAALAENIIDAARLGLDIGSHAVLNAYCKRRQLDIETRVFGVNNFNKIVSTDAPTLKALRRSGLKSLEALPGLKQLAMQIGLAPQLDQGRLLKGDAL